MAAVLLASSSLVPTLAAVPDRYAAVDAQRPDDAAAQWTDHALQVMEPDAVIVSWWSYSTPLWYAQRVQGRRPDIAIIDDRTRLDENLGALTDVIDANLGKRPVYVIRLDPREVWPAGPALRARLHRRRPTRARSTRVVGPRGPAGG